MKIGIYTIHACCNFGALLQTYATARFITENGHQAEIVNLMTKSNEDAINYRWPWKNLKGILYNIYALLNPAVHKKVRHYKEFRKLLPLSKRYYSKEEIINNPPCYDIHLVGSDQVWNTENGLKDSFYYLPFLPPKALRISYASSFGNIDSAKRYQTQIISLLSKFAHRSVREQDAANYLTNECHLPTNCVLDPTFLLSPHQWDEISGSSSLIEGKYILYYGFDNNKTYSEILRVVRNTLKIPLVGLSVSLHSPYKFDKFYQSSGPIEFLNLIKNATFIVTSSFHGMALAINFHKDFIVLKHGTRMSRMESLLDKIGLSERLIANSSQLTNILHNKLKIDYQSIDIKLSETINKSQIWLITKLNNKYEDK